MVDHSKRSAETVQERWKDAQPVASRDARDVTRPAFDTLVFSVREFFFFWVVVRIGREEHRSIVHKKKRKTELVEGRQASRVTKIR